MQLLGVACIFFYAQQKYWITPVAIGARDTTLGDGPKMAPMNLSIGLIRGRPSLLYGPWAQRHIRFLQT